MVSVPWLMTSRHSARIIAQRLRNGDPVRAGVILVLSRLKRDLQSTRQKAYRGDIAQQLLRCELRVEPSGVISEAIIAAGAEHEDVFISGESLLKSL